MSRVGQELELVRSAFAEAEFLEHGGVNWVRIPSYPLPEGFFKQGPQIELAFRIPVQSGEAPYGFWVRPGLELLSGGEIGNYSYPVATPWGADWGQFSWAPMGEWVPKTDIRTGANMLDFARSFATRLKEGT